MANTILFVFEGARTERLLLQSFQRYYFTEGDRSLITATFNTTIYSLYRELQNDEFLDLVELLRERSPENNAALEGISREDISETYLFFDHDGHATNAAEYKLEQLLAYFDEETEQGKLYVSYPMVEAVKHIRSDTNFQNILADIRDNQVYKNLVSRECSPQYSALHLLDQNCWHSINQQHCMKAWSLVSGDFDLPPRLIPQMEIFMKQLKIHITPAQRVAVLSAFPLLLLDYYGAEQSGFLFAMNNSMP